MMLPIEYILLGFYISLFLIYAEQYFSPMALSFFLLSFTFCGIVFISLQLCFPNSLFLFCFPFCQGFFRFHFHEGVLHVVQTITNLCHHLLFVDDVDDFILSGYHFSKFATYHCTLTLCEKIYV